MIDLAGAHRAAGRRHRGRGQPQADLGRRQRHQGRRQGLCLCRRPRRPADRPSRHQPGAAQHQHEQARAGAHGARRSARRQAAERRQRPLRPCARRHRRCFPRSPRSRRWAGWSSSSSRPPRRCSRSSPRCGRRWRCWCWVSPPPRSAPGSCRAAWPSPIRVLSAGAERLGGGDLGHRIEVRTGDEVEALADNFNRMAGQLQESHATLEQRVVDRTRELTETLEQQTATAEILRVISQSPTDVQPVLDAVVKAAVRFCGAADAVVGLREGDEVVFAAHEGPLETGVGRAHPAQPRNRHGACDHRQPDRPISWTSPPLDPVEFAGGPRTGGRVRLPRRDGRPDDARRHSDRRDRPAQARAGAFHVAPDRAARRLSPPRPSSPSSNVRLFTELQRIAGAADGDGRNPAGHLPVADRRRSRC